MNRESLVSISEASRILGVSEATLRQWTDEGKMKAFITPGGHRRYSRTELKKFMTSSQKVLGVKDLAAELEDTAQIHREVARTFLSQTPWYSQINEDAQKELVVLSRRILNLIISYMTEPTKREDNVELARDIGQGFGETLARVGLPLTDSVEAFIRHRDPIMNAITQMMRRREALNGRVVETIPLVTQVMDEALVSLVAAHQQWLASRNTLGKGTIA